MLKSTKLAQAVALALILPGVACAEFEISGAAKIEYSLFTKDGLVTGASEPHKAGDAMKVEPSIKLFINSDVGESSAFHAEVLLADDGEAASPRLEGGEPYSQYEYLREFYFDTQGAGWDWRLGKQQVVWGTADGIKLLDIINPTDYRELNQNTSEDSRIPVWMVNAEKYFDNGGNIQVIVSEARPNFIAGLDADGDSGAPFIFKGVDTITGKSGGFLNIAPKLGATASQFVGFASMAPVFGAIFSSNTDAFGPASAVDDFSGVTDVNSAFMAWGAITAEGNFGPDANGDFIPDGLQPTSLEAAGGGTFTVQNFIDGMSPFCAGGSPAIAEDLAQAQADAAYGANAPDLTGAFGSSCGEMLNTIAQVFAGNNGETNLVEPTYDSSNPNSAFEYMNQATFATFDTFAGISTLYRQDQPEGEFNFGVRYKASTDGGMNYSLNYLYAYDPNPIVNIHWEDSSGNELTAKQVATAASPDNAGDGATINPDPIYGEFPAGSKVSLFNQNGSAYTGAPATLVFEETMKRVNNLGASFDMALDTESVPVVLRGEFLYQQGAAAPVIDRNRLAIGDLVGALKMEEADYFKYVLGVDVTVLTNLLVSTQLIQMYNLDYVDQGTDANGANCGATANCGRYTGDFSSMSLTNGLNKGDEVETFVSFFLSKPFGSDVQHRWNNILIAENGGGYWNRFDVEYSFNDEVVGTVEYNKYWGDEDTTFGQFENSSNLQLGLKYIF
jgi:hypothetical protein